MATIIKELEYQSNYMVLKNTGTDVIVYDRITVPDWIKEGHILLIEFDQANRGPGVFIKNRLSGTDNMLLSCWRSEKTALLSSKISANGAANKDVLSHIVDALQAIVASNNTARDAAVSAAANANILRSGLSYESRPWTKVVGGNFAYGPGGPTFLKGLEGDTIGGITYYDYFNFRLLVTLIFNGQYWEQKALDFSLLS